MAEGGGVDVKKNTLPQRGKVKQVRQEWAVHEDSAYAYQLQNEEIDRHYGLNRFNRRTVREDIPIAKVAQSDEEVQQQNERFQQLQALRAQAEEDERVARQMMEQEQLQQEAHKMARELTDEEFAKAVQEKEKQKYERYVEKKKLQKLKKEREQIERSVQQKTEEARLLVKPDGGTAEAPDERSGDNAMRVTPLGQIEDNGDFSDFYNLPENLDPAHRQILQEIQDEELAKLLQDQEHKRSKAEVDRTKLREIEEQDQRLAQIIQEQEKIRLRKAKQKRKQQEEARKAQEQVQRPPALPPRNIEHDHRRYRRNSFIQSMENGPDQGDNSSTPSDPSDGYMSAMQIAAEQRLQGSPDPRSGDPRAAQNNRPVSAGQSLNNARRTVSNPSDTKQNVQKVQNNFRSSVPARAYHPSQLPQHEMPDVERWLASQPPDASRGRLRSDNSEHLPDSPSPPGSYHSEDAFPYGPAHHDTSVDNGSHYAVSDPFNFNNIAAAIDPTYTPRAGERISSGPQVTRSLPQEDRTISTVSSRGDNFHDDGPAVVSPFVPVQGQRRSGDKGRKSKKSDSDKEKCKQQ